MKKRLLAVLLVLVMLIPVMASAETRILKYGHRGADVLEVQNRLKYYGYYSGNLDSIFGSSVQKAVKAFQTANKLKVDGKVGPATLSALQSETAVSKKTAAETATLAYGSHGEAVKKLQTELKNAFYYTGKIDGIFGSEVNTAVKNFQASAGLTVDGKVGNATRNALYNHAAKIFNGGIPVRNLYAGYRGYDVYVLQLKLTSLNYMKFTTDADGYYGKETVAAVKKFQKANGLTEDGNATLNVRRYLWPTATNAGENIKQKDDEYPTLKLGSHGAAVSNAQMHLKAGGYLLGKADGVFGEDTEKAVIALQKYLGLKQDGIIGPDTWVFISALNVSNAEQEVTDPSKPSTGAATTSLRRGSRGGNVTKLQKQLIELGYLSAGADDGKFGPITAEAVKNFQKDSGITADGVAGSKTFVALNEALGIQWDTP